MKKSLWKKICITGIVLSSVFILLNLLLTYLFMAPFSTIAYREQVEEIAEGLKNRITDNELAVKDYMEELDENHNIKITILDGDKNVIYTTRTIDIQQSKSWPAIVEQMDAKDGKLYHGESVFLARKTTKREHQVVNLVLLQKIADDRFVVISRSYQSLINATYTAMVFELVIGIPMLLIVVVIIYYLSRRMVRPIKEMTETAAQISRLDFDKKVTVTTEDEVGQLGNAINKMSEHLENDVAMMQKEIEERKKLVRNLSHEIKSPVAVIMGYADRLKTILSKNPKKAVEYCEIISNESTRVDVLVREMLELSRLEQGTDEVVRESFPAKRLFDAIRKRFHEENMERQFVYTDHFEEEDAIFADYILLERAVYNLINNALQHGTGDDMKIHVTGCVQGEYYEIRVYNSGSRIEENELESVWNVFSKVDKARSRGKGYGIGLAIVREIVEVHEGYYSVEKKEDGVEFCIAIRNKKTC